MFPLPPSFSLPKITDTSWPIASIWKYNHAYYAARLEVLSTPIFSHTVDTPLTGRKKIFSLYFLMFSTWVLQIELIKDRLTGKKWSYPMHMGLHKNKMKNPKEVIRPRGLYTILTKNKCGKVRRESKWVLNFKGTGKLCEGK